MTLRASSATRGMMGGLVRGNCQRKTPVGFYDSLVWPPTTTVECAELSAQIIKYQISNIKCSHARHDNRPDGGIGATPILVRAHLLIVRLGTRKFLGYV